MEPSSLLIGQGLPAVGFLAGRLGRARQPVRGPRPIDEVVLPLLPPRD